MRQNDKKSHDTIWYTVTIMTSNDQLCHGGSSPGDRYRRMPDYNEKIENAIDELEGFCLSLRKH